MSIKRSKLIGIAIAILAVTHAFIGSARAGDAAKHGVITAGQLRDGCADTAHVMDNGFCIGFIKGVHSGLVEGIFQTFEVGHAIEGKAAPKGTDMERAVQAVSGVCMDDSVTSGDTIAAVKHHLNHGADLSEAATIVVLKALRKTWPCK